MNIIKTLEIENTSFIRFPITFLSEIISFPLFIWTSISHQPHLLCRFIVDLLQLFYVLRLVQHVRPPQLAAMEVNKLYTTSGRSLRVQKLEIQKLIMQAWYVYPVILPLSFYPTARLVDHVLRSLQAVVPINLVYDIFFSAAVEVMNEPYPQQDEPSSETQDLEANIEAQ